MPETSLTDCARCGTAASAGARFCSRCGAALGSDDLPTLSSPGPRTPAASPSSRGSAPKSGTAEPHFVPGTVLAGRYRIVALLGRGGMGEVYRADDLTLGQPVALKFLPEAASGEEMLARFRNEVRIARRVSHRNVCRVYDIGEAEGRHFLSMEYVDGEDLASLLKRIGRLPHDKAVDVARRLCAGLAAAHEKGVLHRDLKPANVMLDRQGEVVITDFGLAVFADQVSHHDVRSGTPSYMAPEQLAGAEVSARSDIYSLGLVLYEIFTGRRAFDAKTLAAAARGEPSDTRPDSPSSVVKDLDPAVEHAILWCLEREPERRPGSALAVSAALPGGDPLAAALRAGQTPSPELVAEAGRTAGVRPRKALLALTAAVLSLAAIVAIAVRVGGLERVGVKPPQALEQRAREILAGLGHAGVAADTAYGFGEERELVRHLETIHAPRPDWGRLLATRPPIVYFWYRSSPSHLVTTEVRDDMLTPGVVGIWEPPATESGMANVGLDAHGRLNFLQLIPPERETPSGPSGQPDWDALFTAAELDRRQFQPAEPEWTSLAASDTRAAWTGSWPGSGLPLRVEAAALRGRPVYFQLVGPWTHPYRMQRDTRTAGQKAGGLLGIATGLLVIGLAVALARRNALGGRADRRGALRLGSVVFGLHLALWACRSQHFAALAEVGLLLLAIGNSIFMASVTWLLYLALEPYVRKHWPQAIISWSRLLAGRFRDPLVGRDLLSGVLLGLLWALIFHVFILIIQGHGASPQLGYHEYLLGGRRVLGTGLTFLIGSIRGTLVLFFVVFLLRALLRRTWLVGIAFVLLFATPNILASRYLPFEAPAQLAVYTIAFVAVARFGLVTLAAGMLTTNLLMTVPVASSLSSWHAGATVFVVASVLALAGWGCHTSLAGQKLWSGEIFE